MSVTCGNKIHTFPGQHHHASVAQVRLCFSRPLGLKSEEELELDAHDDAVYAMLVKSEIDAESYGMTPDFDFWHDERMMNA